MKMPSLDGASIKKFFVYHCEKLILGLSVLLLGLFFWFGYSTPTYDKVTPSRMTDQAKQANGFMNSPGAWDIIKEMRQGTDDVDQHISQAVAVKAGAYRVGPASYPVKRDSLRRDAILECPVELRGVPFISAVMIQPKARAVDPLPLVRYPLVAPKIDFEDEKSSDEMSMDMGMGMGMNMGMGMPGMADDSSKKKKKKPEDEIDAGTFVSKPVEITTPGVRSTFASTSVMSFNMNGVAVTGLVNHEKMWKNFRSMYKSSFGYHPDRDTPRYDFVQVQRRVVNDDGSSGEWQDISNQLAAQRDFFPRSLATAPEIVSAEYFDAGITMPIPPFKGIDYKEIAVHEKATLRKFKVPEKVEEEVATAGDLNIDEEDMNTGRRTNSLGQSGGGGFGRGMGSMGAPGAMDMGSMGAGGMMGGGLMGGGMTGPKSGGRSSSDNSDYKPDYRNEPKVAHKVLRFFDIHGVKTSLTYEYRVRVWLRDPNNEDPTLKGDISGGDNAMGGMGGVGGVGGMMGGGMGMGGPGGGARSGGKATGSSKDDDEMTEEEIADQIRFASKQQIANSMIHPEARERLSRAREEKDKDGNKTYYVSERRGDDWEEIKVPRNQDYLRFARPTTWSETLKVTVDTQPSFVYAGEPVETRRIKVGRGTVPDGEPSMKIATGKYMQGGRLSGVKIPFKAEVKAGELLDFDRPTHVLHPETSQVHKVMDVEVKTGAVVIDVANGEKLATKKSSAIPYYYPGELLVMDAGGGIELRNDLEDRGSYIAAILEKDEKASFGRKRKPKKSNNPMGEMGGPGKLGGLGAPGGGLGGGLGSEPGSGSR